VDIVFYSVSIAISVDCALNWAEKEISFSKTRRCPDSGDKNNTTRRRGKFPSFIKCAKLRFDIYFPFFFYDSIRPPLITGSAVHLRKPAICA